MDVRPTRRDNEFFVSSETGEGEYQVICANGQWLCTCKAFITKNKEKKPCKHIDRVLEYLKEMEGGVEPEKKEGDADTPPPANASPLRKWVKQIHGRDFITYEGLLAMAHAQGLITLTAKWTEVTPDAAYATAIAIFKDGRQFSECGDATPTNVGSQVKAHFPRVALTRAKARVLRDTLNIGMVSVEELEE